MRILSDGAVFLGVCVGVSYAFLKPLDTGCSSERLAIGTPRSRVRQDPPYIHQRHGRSNCAGDGEEDHAMLDLIKSRRVELVHEATGVFLYELDVKATGQTTRRVNQRVLEPLKESIRYPGFKPGQIPPFMWPEIKKFVVEEIVNESIVKALDVQGLEGADGWGTEAVMVDKEVEDLVEVFKPGKPLSFKFRIDAHPKADGEREVDEELAQGTEGP